MIMVHNCLALLGSIIAIFKILWIIAGVIASPVTSV